MFAYMCLCAYVCVYVSDYVLSAHMCVFCERYVHVFFSLCIFEYIKKYSAEAGEKRYYSSDYHNIISMIVNDPKFHLTEKL